MSSIIPHSTFSHARVLMMKKHLSDTCGQANKKLQFLLHLSMQTQLYFNKINVDKKKNMQLKNQKVTVGGV